MLRIAIREGNVQVRKYNTALVLGIYIATHTLIIALSFLARHLLLDGALSLECVFYKTFSLYCPGCGGTRALSALLEFNIIKSFILYPPILITVGFILYIDTLGVISLIKKSYAPIRSFKGRYTVIIPISIMLFFILRNILKIYGIDLVELASSF